jgi:hypothetical protein
MKTIIQGIARFVCGSKRTTRAVTVASLSTLRAMLKVAKLGATKEIDFFLKDLKRRHRAETSAIVHQAAQEANRARETKIKADYAEAKERSQIDNERVKVQSEAFEKILGALARLRESGGEVYVDTEELLNRIGCCKTNPRVDESGPEPNSH